MTWIELVKQYFPDATDEEADVILWEETGFPEFWQIPADGANPIECCRKQLRAFRRRLVRRVV